MAGRHGQLCPFCFLFNSDSKLWGTQCHKPKSYVVVLGMVVFEHQLQLVGGLEHFLFSHILGIVIPID